MKSPVTQKTLDRIGRLIEKGKTFSTDSNKEIVDPWRIEVGFLVSSIWGDKSAYATSLSRSHLYDNKKKPRNEGLQRIIAILDSMWKEVDNFGVPGIHTKRVSNVKVKKMKINAGRDIYVQEGGKNQKQLVNNGDKNSPVLNWILLVVGTIIVTWIANHFGWVQVPLLGK